MRAILRILGGIQLLILIGCAAGPVKLTALPEAKAAFVETYNSDGVQILSVNGTSVGGPFKAAPTKISFNPGPTQIAFRWSAFAGPGRRRYQCFNVKFDAVEGQHYVLLSSVPGPDYNDIKVELRKLSAYGGVDYRSPAVAKPTVTGGALKLLTGICPS